MKQVKAVRVNKPETGGKRRWHSRPALKQRNQDNESTDQIRPRRHDAHHHSDRPSRVGTLTLIRPLRPLLTSTFPTDRAGELTGKNKPLRPSDITRDATVTAAITAQYFAGSATVHKEYRFEDVHCGRFPPTYELDSPVDWSKWDVFESAFKHLCPSCEYRSGCPWLSENTGGHAEPSPTRESEADRDDE